MSNLPGNKFDFLFHQSVITKLELIFDSKELITQVEENMKLNHINLVEKGKILLIRFFFSVVNHQVEKLSWRVFLFLISP